MGKVSNYLGFILVLIIIFRFAGIVPQSPSSWALGFALDPTTWSTSSFLNQVGAVLAVLGGSISLALLIVTRDPVVLRIPFALFLITVGWDIFGIYNILQIISQPFALLMCAPLMLIYIVSVVEWAMGLDT